MELVGSMKTKVASKIRPLKQELGSNNCVAIVAAMATGCLPEDFEKRISHDPPYHDMELFVFLWELGYGLVFGFAGIQDFNPLNYTLRIDIDLKDYMAYIAVKSETNDDLTHAILWDGKQIYDPNPQIQNGRGLNEYEVIKIYPFTKMPVGELNELERD
jgi:hypothetical protein